MPTTTTTTTATRTTPCRNCGNNKTKKRRRGLCEDCYRIADVRDRNGKDFYGQARQPKPTRTLPGTAARIRVYQERAERGEEIKPYDSTYDRVRRVNLN